MWLEKALEVLKTQGSAKLHIASLSRDLGVSKGSFYWHFKDRSDFIHALVRYWDESFTQCVKADAEAQGGKAQERLRFILCKVFEEGLASYDSIFDAWGAHDTEIRNLVMIVYRYRHDYIKSLFAELGFAGGDLELRTQVFMGFLKYHSSNFFDHSIPESPRDLDRQLAYFTGPLSG